MFALSKIIGFFLDPLVLALLLIGSAVLALVLRYDGVSRGCLWAGAAILVLGAATPLGPYAAHVLETRYPLQPALPPVIGGIIVLGGSPDVDRSAAWGVPLIAAQSERLTSLVALARRYPTAPIIYSGGYGQLGEAPTTEAAVARRLLEEIGFNTSRVHFEDRSRNTLENVALSLPLVGSDRDNPDQGRPWLLVTGALHMPRAVAMFEREQWSVLPWPVAPQTAGPTAFWSPLAPSTTLALTRAALHEWVGLAAFRLLGRQD